MQEFAQKYPPDCKPRQSAEAYARALLGFTRAADRLARYGGCSFGGGIYRLYGAEEIETWTTAVHESFPEYAGRVRCFGRDWLCNQFCLDNRRLQDAESMVLLFEIGTGKVLKIPETFAGFHSQLIVEDPDAALAEDFFDRWRTVDSRPLGAAECVGYKVPLVLGGQDEVSNLERSDASVYWHLMTQVLMKTRNLPPETKVRGVSGEG
ncbi:hypothetical protein GCM10011487_42390 [Steroidobacter agaridevorans]|uniref:T6SS immunity protein Tdi1 C-terminal domain-containing protein n=1 Tax=Steroidobacter agaridevorans TaxID=2695856 RepID=A0A829YG42_9GAMM|nr:T6SS immunity protein Tdi1 domain-containing protein [Steroidobacter agaridevorans]GFE82239.1 hypothetical protein GCM10011487_42390 [Steroidobacter agaridevorans]GFE85373.1 hypothetical protein GCM10011488_03270 [Steroidobacter agaridevorans]